MVLWFVVVAPVIVAEVFQSQRLDYRFVAFGALFPVVSGLSEFGLVFHTLIIQLAILTIVMLVTIGKRLTRRRWLGLPIGGLLHLVLDGTWLNASTFWWPLFGADLSELVANEVEYLNLMVLLDLVALVIGWWAIKRYGLTSRENRSVFISTGQLPQLR